MTESQRYLQNSHLESVEMVQEQIESLGFELTRLAEWGGGQPHTEFSRPGAYILIFGHARMELYVHGVKVDGCRIHAYAPHTIKRLLDKAA